MFQQRYLLIPSLFLMVVALAWSCSNSSSSTDGTGGEAGASNQGGQGGTSNEGNTSWVGTWATAPMLIGEDHLPPDPGLEGNTLRQVVRTSVGGEGYRIQLSNLYGDAELTLRTVHVALSEGQDTIDPDTDQQLTFDGEQSVTIPSGEEIFSDPIDEPLEPMTQLAVTIHFGDVPTDITGHPGSRATSYLAGGKATTQESMPSAATAARWYVLTGVDIQAPPPTASVAVLGDSITDGYGVTTDSNRRWTDFLSQRLRQNEGTDHVGVLNLGISGNAVLTGGLGPTARARFERDVLEQRGIRWLVVFIGVNDIGAGSGSSVADALIESYGEFIDVARAHGLYVYGATITPFADSQYDSADHEETRQLVNEWIRTSDSFDAVIDFDQALRDPDDPQRLLPKYDNDHLHPNEEGYEALAAAVDLELFSAKENREATNTDAALSSGYPCAGSVPPGPIINDFSTWSSGNFGDSSTLTGGTFYYDGDGDDSVQALSIDVTDEVGTVSGEITADYAGFGFWLASCIDASSYDGIQFDIGGEPDGASIEFQVQTSRNYPIDDSSSKGECEGDWSDCVSNQVSVEITTEVTTVQVPWTDLTGGMPIDTMDPTEILGLQWQVNCASCTPEFTLDEVQFFSAN